MIKNRNVQLIFQTIFITLSLFGIIGSLGYFDKSFNTDFYAYYTNLSNYICMGLIFASFVQTIKKAKNKEDGFVSVASTFSFLAVILILVTFLVYNILLAKDKSPAEYFLSPGNLILHLILPLMYIAHWIMFYEHGKIRWFNPLLCTVMPLIYVVLIFIRAAIINALNIDNVMIYPYFFLNAEKIHWYGVTMWVSILVVIFIIIGYIFYFFDNFTYFKIKLFKNGKKIEEKNSDLD